MMCRNCSVHSNGRYASKKNETPRTVLNVMRHRTEEEFTVLSICPDGMLGLV